MSAFDELEYASSSTNSHRLRTVCVNFEKLIPDEAHRNALRSAVERTHQATLLATELLNLFVRDRLENYNGEGLGPNLFDPNWLLQAYSAVCFVKTKTGKDRALAVAPELVTTRDTHMPAFDRVDRQGIGQVATYECRGLAAAAKSNVRRHFRRRVLSHVRLHFAIPDEQYKALSKDEKRARRLALMQTASDLLRPPSEQRKAPVEKHQWIAEERARLGIDTAVGAGAWGGKPIEYHLESRPHDFLSAMSVMLRDRQAAGRSSFSIFPLRRKCVPMHCRFCQRALHDLLDLESSDYEKERQRAYYQSVKRRKTEQGRVDLEAPPPEPKKRAQRKKEDTVDEKLELFSKVFDLHSVKLRQRDQFDFAFTTDGVCVRLQCSVVDKSVSRSAKGPRMPQRGKFAIDELKRLSRAKETDLHVVGIDPGKRELVVAVDQDDTKGSPVVRYTQQQRQRDLRTRQYEDEHRRGTPHTVVHAQSLLSECNSRSVDLETFKVFCKKRRELHAVALPHYADIAYRRRRWKKAIKTQQSEERLYQRLRGMHAKSDKRALVLAYGSWGAVAGRAGAVANKGNASCVGAGLMNRIAKRFVVVLTPEQYTSKTCCRCLGPCGPWKWLGGKQGRKIRGVRVCQNEECRLPQNRDRTGAANIGLQFRRLYRGEGPIREMTDEDRAIHAENVALCAPCD